MHNTGGMETIQQDNAYHVNEAEWSPNEHGGAPHIAYTLWIPREGTAVWCNELWERSWHANLADDRYVGIALQGDGRTNDPTPTQKASLKYLINTWLPAHGVTVNEVYGHCEVGAQGPGPNLGTATICPGAGYLKYVQELRG